MPDIDHRTLIMNYSGRIIDQLGIQMYQSPVAAVAELVANAWDADSENVSINLPTELTQQSEIVITDDGNGMTFNECQERYLNVGYCRRGNRIVENTRKGRIVLGRKGIGKFAGFGIAEIVQVETTSVNTGEKTVFLLNLNELRRGEYVHSGHSISVQEYIQPNTNNINNHGTKLILRSLKLRRAPSEAQFLRSISRRFLLHQRAADFQVKINDNELTEINERDNIEYSFPSNYRDNEKPSGIEISPDGWGIETLPNNKTIRWKIHFYRTPIDEEELRGISIFCHGKLCQSPFFFNLTGGLGGQHGQEYVTGTVEADYIDEQADDFVSPERQRIDFKSEEAIYLENWGQQKLKSLFRIWRDRRGEERVKRLDEKIAPFSQRLDKLPKSERKIVRKAVVNIAKIPALEEEEFIELGNSILTSWEGGRLKELISVMSESESMNENDFLHALIETGVLSALNIAEAVKTKLEAIIGLQNLISKKVLENPLRDYISENPWLIAPRWETYRKERSVEGLLRDCAKHKDVKFDGEIYKGRVDLALSSGNHLLVLEFMKPGLTLDSEHLHRFELYIYQIRTHIESNTRYHFTKVTGYLVADKLEHEAGLSKKLQAIKKEDMFASDWKTLLRYAVDTYREYLEILCMRSPDDERLKRLLNE